MRGLPSKTGHSTHLKSNMPFTAVKLSVGQGVFCHHQLYSRASLRASSQCEEQALLAERRSSSQLASTSGTCRETLNPSPATVRRKPAHKVSIPLSPVEIVKTVTLPVQTSYHEAVKILNQEIASKLQLHNQLRSAVLRFEVPLVSGETALEWLRGQSALQKTQPSIYFSPRKSSAPTTEGIAAAEQTSSGCMGIAGVGSAWTWRGDSHQGIDQTALQGLQAFLSPQSPRIRALGGSRFDTSRTPANEWKEFGSFHLMLPRVEYSEAGNCNLLACTLAWHADDTSGNFTNPATALADSAKLLAGLVPPSKPSAPALQVRRGTWKHMPDEEGWVHMMQPVHDVLRESNTSHSIPDLEPVDPSAALQEYESRGQGGLDALLAALDAESTVNSKEDDQNLTKVVLARRTDIDVEGDLDSLAIIKTLQGRDPRAFQLYLRLPSGATFLGSTPELLYERSGRHVATEAVAGTRPRGPPGDVQKDFWLAFDLLRDPKDHAEFCIVRDWVYSSLKGLCEDISLDTEKSVLKQGVVQHLYGRISATLHSSATDADILGALHPTPAVCGRPRGMAQALLHETEPFDRGFYSGPFGWISGDASEFAVAIRSALVQPQQTGLQGEYVADQAMQLPRSLQNGANAASAEKLSQQIMSQTVSLFAGVGIVRGSVAAKEWQELDLKVSQFQKLMRRPPAWKDLPNVNLAVARLMVEELCRHGITTFCIAPGSRSSALTAAVAMQPSAAVVPCIDERSLAFWALGHGRANRTPAVIITSSGTAVANLLPAVVEASQGRVPLILMTADRPVELRDAGANQAIDQVKVFGGYTRWATDLSAPDSGTPAAHFLTTVGAAVRHATGANPGPVHLNCQFREPLGPAKSTWSPTILQGLEHWERSISPYTQPVKLPLSGLAGCDLSLFERLASCGRGLAVVGEQPEPQEAVACLKVAEALGWPLVADVLSGLKVGQRHGTQAVLHMDSLLLAKEELWSDLKPQIILQFGGRLTSKRTQQFLEWSATDSDNPALWVFVDELPDRQDAGHCVRMHIQSKPSQFASSLLHALSC